jgi:membrane associated rhomboid family serine protease
MHVLKRQETLHKLTSFSLTRTETTYLISQSSTIAFNYEKSLIYKQNFMRDTAMFENVLLNCSGKNGFPYLYLIISFTFCHETNQHFLGDLIAYFFFLSNVKRY